MFSGEPPYTGQSCISSLGLSGRELFEIEIWGAWDASARAASHAKTRGHEMAQPAQIAKIREEIILMRQLQKLEETSVSPTTGWTTAYLTPERIEDIRNLRW